MLIRHDGCFLYDTGLYPDIHYLPKIDIRIIGLRVIVCLYDWNGYGTAIAWAFDHDKMRRVRGYILPMEWLRSMRLPIRYTLCAVNELAKLTR